MTLDDTTLASALHDLAATAPTDAGRLSSVHRRAYRLHRRHRVVGAGAIAATMAAAVVGTEIFVASGRDGGSATIRGAGAPPASAPPPTAAPSGAAPRAACPDTAPVSKPGAPVAAPTIGQQVTGGGTIASAGGATNAVEVVIIGGPLAGAQPPLAITPDTKIFVSSPNTNVGDVPATAAQLVVGQAVKFSATRSGASTYVLDEIHAASVGGAGTVDKTGAPATSAGPPPVGGMFKAGGVALASSVDSVTVNVDRGNLTGTITFTLGCTLTRSLAGDLVELAGTRTGPSTYEARDLMISRPPANP